MILPVVLSQYSLFAIINMSSIVWRLLQFDLLSELNLN